MKKIIPLIIIVFIVALFYWWDQTSKAKQEAALKENKEKADSLLNSAIAADVSNPKPSATAQATAALNESKSLLLSASEALKNAGDQKDALLSAISAYKLALQKGSQVQINEATKALKRIILNISR